MTKEEYEEFDNIEDFMKELQDNVKETWLDHRFPNGLCGYRITYALTHPWKIFEKYLREIKYAWQRIFKGWDNRVIWSIDFYLAKMIPVAFHQICLKKMLILEIYLMKKKILQCKGGITYWKE